jgi:N-acetylneuraminic acid mutarotase
MGIDLQTAIRRAVAGALLFWATIAGPASMDTRAQSWETVSRLPEPRAGAAAVELEGYVYIIGGRSHQSPPSATVFRYDPESNDWEDGDDAPPAMKDARVNATAAVLNGKIFVIGGRGPGGEVLQSVEVYDPGVIRVSAHSRPSRSLMSRTTVGRRSASGVSIAPGCRRQRPYWTNRYSYSAASIRSARSDRFSSTMHCQAVCPQLICRGLRAVRSLQRPSSAGS